MSASRAAMEVSLTTSSSSVSSSASSSRAPTVAGGGAESLDMARTCISSLKEIIGPLSSLDVLRDSHRPAKGLLEEENVAQAILTHMSKPTSGHGQDSLCQWLYDTYETRDYGLQAVVLRFIPALCGLYLARSTCPDESSLAGFEAVLLALYTAEAKARNGRPHMVHIPDLSQPSLYHSPRIPSNPSPEARLGLVIPALEPQDAIKATKRASIVGVALDLFYRRIAFMPCKAKVEACQCAQRFASLSCSNEQTLNEGVNSSATTGNVDNNLDAHHEHGTLFPEIKVVGPEELFLGNSPSYHHHIPKGVLESGSMPKDSPSFKHAFRESFRRERFDSVMPSLQSDDMKMDFASSLTRAGCGARIQLPWELLQPLLKILGHCLLGPLNSDEVKSIASVAVSALHCRVFHDLVPKAMLATQSLMRLSVATGT